MNGKELLQKDIIVNKIALAIKVLPGIGDAVHLDRPSHGFAFHLGGQKTYQFHGQRDIEIDPETVIYMPKGSSYNVTGHNTGKPCYAINFDTTEELSCEPFSFKPKDPAKMLLIFKEAEKAWRTKSPGHMEKCFACISDILAIMKSELSSSYSSGSRRILIEPALKYISEHYTNEKISVSLLADICGISEVYLRRIFLSIIGKTPVAYINHMRLERGYDLLMSGEYSVSNAAKECGFPDECYFSREFKKLYGFTPSRLK